MKAVIVDDDPVMREQVRRLLEEKEGICVVAEAGNAAEARAALERRDYDVAFLNVRISGEDVFGLVPLVEPGAGIIFVTECPDQAARAFEIDAVDYIVAPLTAERLAQAIHRLERRKGRSSKNSRLRLSIFLRGVAGGGRFAASHEIVAILSSQNYCEVLLANGERWLVRQTMRGWEDELPPGDFARIHRGAIVNLDYVERVKRTDAETACLSVRGLRQELPVARRLWPKLRVRLENLNPK